VVLVFVLHMSEEGRGGSFSFPVSMLLKSRVLEIHT
jgi:hypothetical protein